MELRKRKDRMVSKLPSRICSGHGKRQTLARYGSYDSLSKQGIAFKWMKIYSTLVSLSLLLYRRITVTTERNGLELL